MPRGSQSEFSVFVPNPSILVIPYLTFIIAGIFSIQIYFEGFAPSPLYNNIDSPVFLICSDKEKARVNRLMGIKGELAAHVGPLLPPPEASGHALSLEEQEKVLRDVEGAFVAGLRRKDGRTMGLGAEQ